jgi:plasmid stabilization system protein ParE
VSYEIWWTPQAVNSFNENLECLASDWGASVVNDFIDHVDSKINQITTNPLIYPLHRGHDQIHKCLVNKRILLFYRIVTDSQIDLLTFWNTYRNPADLNF